MSAHGLGPGNPKGDETLKELQPSEREGTLIIMERWQ